MVSNCGFDLHFLVTNEAGHLSLYLLTICTSSSFKCIFKSFTYFFKIFLLLKYILCGLKYELFYQIHVLQVFLLLCCLFFSFILLIISLQTQMW